MSNSKELYTDPIKTGEWFSNLLKEMGYLEHEMAKILGVSEQRVINWASGRRGMRLYMIRSILYIRDEKDNTDYRKNRSEAIKIFMELSKNTNESTSH